MISSSRYVAPCFRLDSAKREGTRAERRKEMKRERRTHRRNVIGSVVFATGAANLFVAEYASDLVPRSPRSRILFSVGFLFPWISSPARILIAPTKIEGALTSN